jgi:carbonic anhydrase/acetyltransferase-like protein (isoleucine patch superfamily)
MKHLIERLIRKLKNPDFKFDPQLTNYMVLGLLLRSVGMALRGQLRFWARPGCAVLLGRRVRLINAPGMILGRVVRFEDYCYIAAIGTGGIQVGHRSVIGAFSRVIVSSSYNNLGDKITIGANVGIGEFAHIGGAGGTSIGDDCIIGAYFSVHPENHGFEDPYTLLRLQPVTRQGITVEHNVWIGAKVTLLDGVHVGHSSVIAAGSVVRQGQYPPYSVLAGVPARIVKKLDVS